VQTYGRVLGCHLLYSLMRLRESGQLTFIDGLKAVLDSCLGGGDSESLLALDRVESEDLARLYAAIRQTVTEDSWIVVDNLSALNYIGIKER
jgi:hypothetical protein